MSELEEITPDDSVVPVFLDPTPCVPVEPVPDPAIAAAAVAAARESGIVKLVQLGLTREQAEAVAG